MILSSMKNTKTPFIVKFIMWMIVIWMKTIIVKHVLTSNIQFLFFISSLLKKYIRIVNFFYFILLKADLKNCEKFMYDELLKWNVSIRYFKTSICIHLNDSHPNYLHLNLLQKQKKIKNKKIKHFNFKNWNQMINHYYYYIIWYRHLWYVDNIYRILTLVFEKAVISKQTANNEQK